MFVIKSRGVAHSNQVREFELSDEGPRLIEVYIGPDGVLTGSARIAQMQREEAGKNGSRDRGGAPTVCCRNGPRRSRR